VITFVLDSPIHGPGHPEQEKIGKNLPGYPFFFLIAREVQPIRPLEKCVWIAGKRLSLLLPPLEVY
jgi:hypothetical protein